MGNSQGKLKNKDSNTIPKHLGNHKCEYFVTKVQEVLEKEFFVQTMGTASGAIILKKSDLSTVAAACSTNKTENPTMTSEMLAIQRYYEIPNDERPNVDECLFIMTHMPSPFGIAAITLCKFDNFIYVNPTPYIATSEEGMEEDKAMWSEVFGINGEELKTNNRYWTSYALSEFSNEPSTSANDNNNITEDVSKAATVSNSAAVNPINNSAE